MQTLQIDKNNARKLYPSAAQEFKTMLEDSFGKDFFSQKITDRVKTFEDACEVLGLDPYSQFTTYDSADEIAYKKLKIIIRALNEGWTPDWNNSSQYKWYNWFYMDTFRFADASDRYSYSDVGSRLCFKSRELAEYAAKQFLSEYKALLTL